MIPLLLNHQPDRPPPRCSICNNLIFVSLHDCGFLFEHYPNIYNKLLKNEIQIQILYRFLDELESIENGKQDQHEASFKIGTLLKQMYVDKKIDMDKENGTKKGKTGMKISYEEFKRQSEKKK